MTLRDLTKWPRLLVTGENVTEEQANEILVRTDSWYVMTNDEAWERAVHGLMGVELTEHGRPALESLREFRRNHGVLDLSYLHNDRIASAWVGGPKGWCSWNGTIGCSTWNIGKWPSRGDVTEDWTAVAEAFPYLNLTAQLISDEGDGALCGQWTIRGGRVEVDHEPATRIAPVQNLTDQHFLRRMTSPGAERGVTLDRLAQALRQVRASQSRAAIGGASA